MKSRRTCAAQPAFALYEFLDAIVKEVVKKNDWCDYQMMTAQKPKPLIRENYLLVAQASVGAQLFRKLYYNIGGKKIEVLRDGNLSCAFFVSAVIKIFGLIGVLHTTVTATITDLKRHGWKPIKKPREGAIIIWGLKKSKSGEIHRHIEFYLGNGNAVSTIDSSPKIHKWGYRPVEEILWNSKIA